MLAVSSALVVFALISAKGFLGEIAYQRRVVNEKNKTVKQLEENIKNIDSLVAQYEIFAKQDPNILGGSKNGIGTKDGDNPRIVLDALPSKYDYPGLVSSLERMVNTRGLTFEGIDGTDQEVQEAEKGASPSPTPVEIVVSVSILGGYPSIQDFFKDLQNSIRPFNVSSMKLTASQSGSMKLEAGLTTYYQPTKNLSVDSRVIKWKKTT